MTTISDPRLARLSDQPLVAALTFTEVRVPEFSWNR
jgi:hypothetical protein